MILNSDSISLHSQSYVQCCGLFFAIYSLVITDITWPRARGSCWKHFRVQLGLSRFGIVHHTNAATIIVSCTHTHISDNLWLIHRHGSTEHDRRASHKNLFCALSFSLFLSNQNCCLQVYNNWQLRNSWEQNNGKQKMAMCCLFFLCENYEKLNTQKKVLLIFLKKSMNFPSSFIFSSLSFSAKAQQAGSGSKYREDCVG